MKRTKMRFLIHGCKYTASLPADEGYLHVDGQLVDYDATNTASRIVPKVLTLYPVHTQSSTAHEQCLCSNFFKNNDSYVPIRADVFNHLLSIIDSKFCTRTGKPDEQPSFTLYFEERVSLFNLESLSGAGLLALQI